MASTLRAGRASWDLEILLRSARWRWMLAAGLVLAVAALNAEHLHELFQTRRIEVDRRAIFLEQLLLWSAWGAAGWPLFRLASWLRERWKSWILFFVLELPLSIVVALGFTMLHDLLQERLVDPGRPQSAAPTPAVWQAAGPRRPPRPGPRPFPAGEADRERLFFLTRTRTNVAVYWMVLGIGAVVTSFLQTRDREQVASRLRLRAARLETELARAQLGTLRDQLRPHFVFNALHTVLGLVQQEKDAEATRVLIALGDLLRSSLDTGDRQEVSLREELAVAQSYLDVERVRFGDRLAVAIDAAPDCLDASVPALLLQPLLENAVRHGIAPRTEGGRIEFRARREGGELVLRVRDDGPGFPAAVLEDPAGSTRGGRRSIGLANARERVRLLYGERQSFELSNDPAGGAVVSVRLPTAGCAGLEGVAGTVLAGREGTLG